ncbi:MAG TPA: Gfo/Idh/MocA family oxidoreductase, partial [Armatimonadetes bacterium]|nr:Gfo/Idh/MocA family oxidoreductase [Armatimonadota bacterium]
AGGIFRGAHLPAYPEIPEAKIVALCDVSDSNLNATLKRMQELYLARAERAEKEGDKERAEQLRQDLKEVRVYKDFRRMLRQVKPDLVDVCTMPDTHHLISVEALRQGAHVMCEKPMARTWLECLEVVEAVSETGKFYQHNENWLFDPVYYTMRKVIEAGLIGDVVAIFLNTSHMGPENMPHFWDPMVDGGGALLDNGVHAIGASWFLAGLEKRPQRVKAAEPSGITIRMRSRILGGTYREFKVEDDGHILIWFEDPDSGAWATAHVEGSWSGSDSLPTMVIGTSGVIRLSVEEGRKFLVITDPSGNERRIEASGPTWTFWPSSFYGEIKNMCQCVIEGRKPLSDENFGAEVQAIVGSAYLSQREGKRAITLDEYKEWALKIKRKHGRKAPEVLIREQLKCLG